MSRSKKRLLIVAVIVLAAAALLFHNRSAGVPGILKTLSYPYDAASGLLSSISSGVRDVLNAVDENRMLKAKLQSSLLEQQRYGEILKENARLQELLELRNQIHGGGTAARVIARGYDKFVNTLVIDRGNNNGIRKDMSAITAKGLAGKVYAVRDNYADVLLLTDPNFSAAVRLQESRHEGVLVGTGHRYCILKYVPTEQTVKEGETVVTSGLDGIFPAGFPVGKVTEVRVEGVEFFQYIEVVPFQPSAKIEEVMIVGRSAELKHTPANAESLPAAAK
ncbi:MAG TPA: rod shape-determining protein MreC [Dissulfurispiraceae bacterium]|nr:rod shape-determining protein MreC [Dissulfurispiraceae bacterium]